MWHGGRWAILSSGNSRGQPTLELGTVDVRPEALVPPAGCFALKESWRAVPESISCRIGVATEANEIEASRRRDDTLVNELQDVRVVGAETGNQDFVRLGKCGAYCFQVGIRTSK